MPDGRGARGAPGGRAVRRPQGERAVRQPTGDRSVRLSPVRRARRPWYRTRAFRLTRTAVLAATLVTGLWSVQEEAPSGAVAAAPAGSSEVASAVRGGASGMVDGEAWRAEGAPGATADARGPRPEHRTPSPSSSAGRPSSPPPPAAGASSPPGRTDPSLPATPAGRGPAALPAVPAAPTASARPRPAAKARPAPGSPATRLVIPYLDIDAPVMELRLDGKGRLPAPPEEDTNLVGWYATGPAPGERGTAVAVGHLDTDTDRAVFWGLSQLAPNHPVQVRRADGRIAVYTVDKLRTYEKARFPNKEVYGDRGRAELRLITCGGAFDRRTGYAGNLVVFAHLVTVKEPDRPVPPA
ncbi:hypothetical protein JCM4814A_56430 [Streptomyces phaeofaciens JCM 4814]|uniref:Class F sortase n=1 Tax=Streptomyces phaeofaciens TaxID=68254 RepID=A0A918HNT5_9ACTN|nr:class F sortase [Streptomyces phaeofaciens]GGT88461.1 hypothetical protein GCM10010226_78470 [Streptomyces phaeofaciens]